MDYDRMCYRHCHEMLDSDGVAGGEQQGGLEEVFARILRGDHEKREDEHSGDVQGVVESVVVQNLGVGVETKKTVEQILARFAVH